MNTPPSFCLSGGDVMIVNGKELNCEFQTIKDLLIYLNLDPNKVVVEVNHSIVLKKSYECYKLSNEDSLEIISFVGGG